MKYIRMLMNIVRGNPVRNAYENVRVAQRHLSRCIAEEQFHFEMVTFYDQRAKHLDPWEKWGEFADAMESRLVHQIDATYWHMRTTEAHELLRARQEQLRKLEEGTAA